MEWTVSPSYQGTYKISSKKHRHELRHAINGVEQAGRLYLKSWIVPDIGSDEKSFHLVPTPGECAEFPEVSVNVEGSVEQLKSPLGQPVRGYVDSHTHLTSFHFMGGHVMSNEPFNKYGVEVALRDSSNEHGPKGSLDIIGNLYAMGDLSHTYDTGGWPDFPYWPNRKDMTHSCYYYKWLERSWKSGQRLIVTDFVENEVLCDIQKIINPSGWVSYNKCNDMDSYKLQHKTVLEMQDYIDAQFGGRGKGFFRIVYSPQEARQVIADGKLAVVLGTEGSMLFNCGIKSKVCTKETIEVQLDTWYKRGVRSTFPVSSICGWF